ncbi:MAG: biotin/lipoyl-binding protein [Clostridia bacterium]|jgi:biotin carboxyl carrier protein|nr:biotin/lipoyl-binding protein [Clostridia bacterium]
MRKFLINVNGTKYEVEVEEIDPKAVRQAAPQAEPAKAPVAAKPVGEGEKVTSPMPGNILSVSVKEGDTVKEGQQLMILEAMKMENEILAPCAGKVTSIAVTKGSTVESGTLLCTIA